MNDRLKILKHGIEYARLTKDNPAFLIGIKNLTEKEDLSFANLGTTKDELAMLLKETCKARAKECIPRLRDKDTPVRIWPMIYEYFQILMIEGGLTLEDVGLSEEKMRKIKQAFQKRF